MAISKLRILYGPHNARKGYLIAQGPQESPALAIYTSPIDGGMESAALWKADVDAVSSYRALTSENYNRSIAVGKEELAILSDKVDKHHGNLQFILHGSSGNFDVLLREIKTDLYLTVNKDNIPIFSKMDDSNVQKFVWNFIWQV